MRAKLFAAIAVLTLPAICLAQNSPYIATVAENEVILRAGPSDQFPDTMTLPKDTRVVVDHEEKTGWLAVQAPPGSVSWVSALLIEGYDASKPTPQNVFVTSENEVTLASGKVGSSEPLNVRRVNLPRGTILVVIGAKITSAGKTWYPVQPPWGDFRYLPKSSVNAGTAINTSFVVRGNDSTTASTALIPPILNQENPAVTPILSTPTKPIVNDPLWVQAETAEKDGRYDDAEKLYFQLAGQMNKPGGDHDIANLCYTRIHSLREKKRKPSSTTLTSAPAREDRTPSQPSIRDPLPAIKPLASPGVDRSPSGGDAPRWSGPGILTLAAVKLDGRPTYALQSDGITRMYVVGAAGVELETYKNKKVDVFGSVYTRRDVSKPYVVASKVELGQ